MYVTETVGAGLRARPSCAANRIHPPVPAIWVIEDIICYSGSDRIANYILGRFNNGFFTLENMVIETALPDGITSSSIRQLLDYKRFPTSQQIDNIGLFHTEQ